MAPTEEEGGARGRDTLRLSAHIAAAYLSGNPTPAASLGALIGEIHETLRTLGAEPIEAPAPRGKPAVPIGRSVQHDFLVCLEDGKKLKMLKRYLRARYGMSPEDYRRRWNLAPDYPMVAPAYAARRSEFAKQIGLGRARRREG